MPASSCSYFETRKIIHGCYLYVVIWKLSLQNVFNQRSVTLVSWFQNFLRCHRLDQENNNFLSISAPASKKSTDKGTIGWFRDFIIWKINSGLWTIVWAGLWKKRVWGDYEQLLRPVFSLFRGQKNFFLKHYSVCTEKLHNTFFL